ncbi:MAG: hypothetical protein Q4A00_08255 [Flavobacteriaceae bacterium]|nr:hypothetical protein [Flavobacteriaceae bacterium]
MNIFILIANILVFLAFVIHTFMGDKELKVNEPDKPDKSYLIKIEKWTMARCGWYWISWDLLMASVGLFLLNFTNFFADKTTVLQILICYFLGYAFVWICTIFISKSFPKNYLKLGQWILLLLISLFLYLGLII